MKWILGPGIVCYGEMPLTWARASDLIAMLGHAQARQNWLRRQYDRTSHVPKKVCDNGPFNKSDELAN